MPLRDFLVILRVQWKIITARVLLVLAAATTLATTPTYTASAQVFLASQQSQSAATAVVTNRDLTT